MTKLTVITENITSFGGFCHVMDVFQSWALKKLPNPYRANADAVARHSVMEAFRILSLFFSYLYGFHTPHLVWVGE